MISASSSQPVWNRSLDPWLIGGLSLLFFTFFHFFVSPQSSSVEVGLLMYYLSFLVNWPHFMASYQILYQDHFQDILKKPAFLWAGLIVPGILLLIISYFLWSSNIYGLSWIVQFLFISVGWHYVKQIFGMMVVPSALNQCYFSSKERKIILTHLYSLWALSFAMGQYQERETHFQGIPYFLLGLPDWVILFLKIFVGISALSVLGLFLRKYILEGRTLHWSGWIAFLSLYAWYLPFSYHPHFFYMIPFFHSLQYLLFVGAVKTKQYSEGLNFQKSEGRKLWIQRLGLFFGSSFLLGCLTFLWLPSGLDWYVKNYHPDFSRLMGGQIFIAVFHLFINIHHYFIDNVIWKKDSKSLKTLMRKTHLEKGPIAS
jgi:hypothetical protein